MKMILKSEILKTYNNWNAISQSVNAQMGHNNAAVENASENPETWWVATAKVVMKGWI